MLKPLRVQFMFITIILIIIILMGGLLCFVGAEYFHGRRETVHQLNQTMDLMELSEGKPERLTIRKKASPDLEIQTGYIVVVETDAKGNIVASDSDNPMEIDLPRLKHLTKEALKTDFTSDVIMPDSVRYYKEPEKSGTRIAFCNRLEDSQRLPFMTTLYLVLSFAAFMTMLVVSEYMATQAINPVAKTMEEQKRFTADASHELKTPLTVILANLDILSSKPDSTIREEQKWIESARSEAKQMTGLINDMLYLARNDTGLTEEPDMTDFDISNTADECVLTSEALAFENGVELTGDIEPHLLVKANEEDIKQVMMSLIENAFKYVDRNGFIKVQVFQKGQSVAVQIINSGPPIPPQKQPHVFDRFYRGEESRTRKGFGLGLSIASTMVRNNGGTIELAYSDETGTCFAFYLPLVKAQ